MSATQQAELVEKEKQLMEQQQRIQQLKSRLQMLANQQAFLEREKRRAMITLGELKTVEATHKVYKGIGRMFVAAPRDELVNELLDKEQKCITESQKLSAEKQTLGSYIEKDEMSFSVAAQEFVTSMRIMQSAQK